MPLKDEPYDRLVVPPRVPRLSSPEAASHAMARSCVFLPEVMDVCPATCPRSFNPQICVLYVELSIPMSVALASPSAHTQDRPPFPLSQFPATSSLVPPPDIVATLSTRGVIEAVDVAPPGNGI